MYFFLYADLSPLGGKGGADANGVGEYACIRVDGLGPSVFECYIQVSAFSWGGTARHRIHWEFLCIKSLDQV